MKKLLVLLFAMLGIATANAQLFHLSDIDTSSFPIMKAKFFAMGADGKSITNFNTSDFDLLEDGVKRKVLSISCSKVEEPKALSSVLTIDVSGSMAGSGLSNAKAAATSWINALPLAKSECAITSFSDNSYLVHDFTTDRNKLLQSVNALYPQNGTDYDGAYWKTILSGLEIANRGKYNRVLVFLTDGQPNFIPQTQKIIDLAGQYNVAVYCVTLNMPSPQCLRDIATKTGGMYFENVTTEAEARTIYLKILNIAQKTTPCTIEWEGMAQCPVINHSVQVDATLKTINSNSKGSYILPQRGFAYLELKPSGVTMWNVPIGTSRDTTIEIKALNLDFNITDITVKNPNFSIKPKSFTLKANESKTLTITYTPTDSLINFCTFDVINDICRASIYARGGFLKQRTINSSFKLTHPNGAEKFGIGTDTIITWEGCSPDEKVNLEYSIDNGLKYTLIAKNARGLQYNWKNIPNTPSTQCLMKASLIQPGDGSDYTAMDITGHGAGVSSISFNTDGKTIASGSFDFTAKIWDVSTGSEIRSFVWNNMPVNRVCFSPDGSTLACSNWGEIRLWDAGSGALNRTFIGHSSYIYGLAYSPDGSKIASGSNDNTIKLWNVNSGLLIRTITGHTSYVNSVCFSPISSTLASGSSDQTIKLWDINSGSEIRTLSGHSDKVTTVSFSPDGTKIASGSGDGAIKLWDANSGALIRNFKGHTLSVNSVSFSPDGSSLVSGSQDQMLMIWDVETGEQLNTLVGHNSAVTSVSYGPDGSKIASGDGDGVIKIWTQESISSVVDISDANWSIIAPKTSTIDIDMGKVLVKSMKDSLVTMFILNKSDFRSRVDSIKIIGPDAAQFDVVAGMPPYTLDANQPKDVEFRFKPSSVGIKNAKIYVYTAVDVVITNIKGEGILPLLLIENQFIDFGKVTVGKFKDTIGVATIKNCGTTPLTITKTKHNKPNNVSFTTLAGKGPFTLAPGETKTMNLEFTPDEEGLTNGTLDFEYNGVGSPAKIMLVGEGVIDLTNIGKMILESGSAEALPGNEVIIPIYLRNGTYINQSGITSINTELSFNSTLLLPREYMDQSKVVDGNRVVTLSLPIANLSNGILANIKMYSGLGNASETEMKLQNIKQIGGTVEMDSLNGEFRLLGVCAEGGKRLLNPTGKIAIQSIKPNPADSDIEVDLELIENSGYKLILVNSLGQVVKEVSRSTSGKGTTSEKMDVSDLSIGVYNLILQTESERMSKIFIIKK